MDSGEPLAQSMSSNKNLWLDSSRLLGRGLRAFRFVIYPFVLWDRPGAGIADLFWGIIGLGGWRADVVWMCA